MQTKEVSHATFARSMKKVIPPIRKDMNNYLISHRNQIDHLEYGHEPGHRIYKVILKSGKEKVWNLKKL